MAKQRRVSSKRPSRKAVRSPRGTVATPLRARLPQQRGIRLAEPASDNHLAAVHIYEQGMEALQQRDYGRAAQLLESVISSYPDEKELHERVRLYLNVCRRQASPPDHTPRTPEERVYAATLAIN